MHPVGVRACEACWDAYVTVNLGVGKVRTDTIVEFSAMHRVPDAPAPAAPRECSTYATGWRSFLAAHPLTLCDGHSTIECAMRPSPGSAPPVAFFCWVRHPYYEPGSGGVWHAICDPTAHWSGDLNDPMLIQAFSRGHNHFRPNAVHPNVPEYLQVHRLASLPAGELATAPRLRAEQGEVAYLLNGDSVTRPRFNPWHADADLLNYYITSRMLSSRAIGGPDGAALAANMSVYPLAGCNGMAAGRGNWDVWRSLAPHVHSARPPSPSPHRGTLSAARRAWPARRGVGSERRVGSNSPSDQSWLLPWLRPGRRASSRAAHTTPRAADAPPDTPPTGRRLATNNVSAGESTGRRLATLAGGRASARKSSHSHRDVPRRAQSQRGATRMLDVASFRSWRPIAAAVLSPQPWAGPLWQMPTPMRTCPHRSEVLHDFRAAVCRRVDQLVAASVGARADAGSAGGADASGGRGAAGERGERVDKLVASRGWDLVHGLLSQILRNHSRSVRLYQAHPRADGIASRARPLRAPPHQPPRRPRSALRRAPRIVYVVRRSKGHLRANETRGCHRCLWNVDTLSRAIAEAWPGALVLLANPGELSFHHQYALFRVADLLLGVHGSAFAWGLFLTPSQTVVEVPLPGSPGLNDCEHAHHTRHTQRTTCATPYTPR